MNRYAAFIAASALLMVLGCGGLPENYREALQYYDESTAVVGSLGDYEAQLRALANQAANGNIDDKWKDELGGVSRELEDILSVEQNNMGVWQVKLKMKHEIIDWINALLAACGEGLKPVISPQKTASAMYHYLDLAAEMGRITRSDREFLIGHYRSLH